MPRATQIGKTPDVCRARPSYRRGMGIKPTKSIVAMMIAALVLTLAPQAAQAAAPLPGLPSGEVVCFLQFRNGILIGEKCIAFRPIWPDCIKCDAIVLDYGVDIYVHDRLVDGFVQLDKAAHTTDPRRRRATARPRSTAHDGRDRGGTRRHQGYGLRRAPHGPLRLREPALARGRGGEHRCRAQAAAGGEHRP